jgi:predicted nuclease with TOPRIM domain
MNLTRREKQIMVAGAVFLGLAMAFQIFVRLALGRVKTLGRVLLEKQQILDELRIKSQEYNSISSELERICQEIGKQKEDRQILSFVERIQKDCGLMQNVVYMKPTTMAINDIYEKTTIEIKLQDITLNQLIQFLLKIESSEMLVGIRTLDIKRRAQKPNLLDAVIQVANLSITERD